MSRYDVEQRVRIVAGPHRHGTGVTMTHYDPSDPNSNEEVIVTLDSSGKIVSAPSRHLRPVVYGCDFEGVT